MVMVPLETLNWNVSSPLSHLQEQIEKRTCAIECIVLSQKLNLTWALIKHEDCIQYVKYQTIN